MNEPEAPSLTQCIAKTVVVHTVTYAACGMIAFTVMDYPSLFLEPGLRDLMRPTSDPLLVLGPVYQVLRGALFGLVFHVLREPLFVKPRGALTMWLMLVGIGILGTFGPTPGSLEGLLYTVVPLSAQLRGLPEVWTQSLVLSMLLVYWVRHPEKKWLSWLLSSLFALICLLPILGFLATQATP